MKKLLSVMLILSLVGTACLFVIGCANTEDETKTPPATAASYVVIDINPTVEMTVSEDNIVISATASNDDAKVLLNQVKIEGKELEAAAEALADASIELGFIAENENGNISITVVGDTQEIEEAVFNKVKGKFRECVEKKCHFDLGVVKDVLLSLETELNALKTANPGNAAIQALNIAEYRMIVSAMEKDATLTLETALTMTNRELMRVIRDGMMKHSGEEFERLELEMEQELEKLKDKIYLEIDNALIKMQSQAIIALRDIEHKIEMLEEFELEMAQKVTLTEENVRQIATLLGLTAEEEEAFVAKCEGLDGTYSVHNLKYAINCLYRNMAAEARETFEDKYERVEDYIEHLEENLTVSPELVALAKSYAEAFLEATKNTTYVIPSNEALANMEVFEEFLEDMEDMVEDVIEDMEDALRELISISGLSEEEKRKLKELERHFEAKEDELEREFERVEDEIEREFKEHINGWMDRHHGGTPRP